MTRKAKMQIWQFTSDDPSEPSILVRAADVRRCDPRALRLRPGKALTIKGGALYRLRSSEACQ